MKSSETALLNDNTFNNSPCVKLVASAATWLCSPTKINGMNTIDKKEYQIIWSSICSYLRH